MPSAWRGGVEAQPGPVQVPGPDAQAYCGYLGDLSTLCVEAETLEERCAGALRCGCYPAWGVPDAVGTMAGGCMCSEAWMRLGYCTNNPGVVCTPLD